MNTITAEHFIACRPIDVETKDEYQLRSLTGRIIASFETAHSALERAKGRGVQIVRVTTIEQVLAVTEYDAEIALSKRTPTPEAVG